MTDQNEPWNPPPMPSQPQSRSWIPTCLIGCLVVFVVGLLVCGGVSWLMLPKIRETTADATRKALVDVVERSEMSDGEKQAVTDQVDRVVEAYKAGDIGLNQVGRVFEELRASPLFGLLIVFAVDSHYIEPSGLPEEEKEEGRLTLQRVARGVFEESIDPNDLEHALDHISVKKSEHQRQLKDKITDLELRDFLAECKRLADEAEVPIEPHELDIGEEFKRAIDRALGES